MTTVYRRHSGIGTNWNRNNGFVPRATHSPLSASFNHRVFQSSLSPEKMNSSMSPSSSMSAPNSVQLTAHQSTSKAGRSPSIPIVSEDHAIQVRTNSTGGSKHEISDRKDILAKGKEREVVRTRPIFHANLEEAKKYHQKHVKTSTVKRIPISSEEILCRYCDHFQFQLPILEIDRFKEGDKKRVLLRIKRRLVGIGEGQTTFQAMLAAYDDTVLYLFKDSKLQEQLLRPNETIEWHCKKARKA